MVDSIRQHDERLRLVLVTDGVGDPNRIVEIAREAVAGGVRCLQLRESTWTARSACRGGFGDSCRQRRGRRGR